MRLQVPELFALVLRKRSDRPHVISRLEGDKAAERLHLYTNPDTPEYARMVEEIRKELNLTSLEYLRLDDMLASIGGDPCRFCTYCWTGKE